MRARSGRLAVFAAGLLLGQQKPNFEIASVKPAASPPGSAGKYVFSSGRVTLENDSLAFLIATAWNVREDEVLGLPSWARTAGFVVDATAGSQAKAQEMQPMLQSLIEERFRLKFHREAKQTDLYLLTRSGNTKTHPAAAQACALEGTAPVGILPCGRVALSMSPSGEARVHGRQVTADGLAVFLGRFWHRKVIDRSELKGTFDVDLTFTIDMGQPGVPI